MHFEQTTWASHTERYFTSLHITDVKVVQNKISTSSKEKMLHAIAEDKVL